MRTLGLLRHAKSSWDDPALDDHDRPLARRGRDAAPKIGAWLQERPVRPDLVLVSSARRAAETWQLVEPALGSSIRVQSCRALYLAEPPQLLQIVQGTSADVASLLLIGHNPGLGRFANGLLGSGPTKLRQRMREKFPTAAVALIRFAIEDWSLIAPGIGELQAFVRPKDLG